ncbi:MAG: hypothetical protein AAB695_02200 [Patescibacteria group bacterium]
MKKFVITILILSSYFLLPTSTHAQSVDLLWQGSSYVPPFYQGRTLWSNQSKVVLLAIPHGLGLAANLNYKWTKNGTVLGNTNGVGKNSLSFLDSILSKPQSIKVDIISSQDEVLASASVVIVPVSPSLLVYEKNPLYGYLFHKEVGGAYALSEKEITLTAFPFFFSVRNRADNTVGYAWRTNVGGMESGNAVTYRAPENVSGSSQVSASASNKDEIAQQAQKSFLVQFGNQ